MPKPKRCLTLLTFIGAALLPLLACLSGEAATAIPAGRPANFQVQTSSPTSNAPTPTEPAAPQEVESALVLPLGDAPTHTPDPSRPQPTARPSATATPTLLPTPGEDISTPEPPPITPSPAVEPEPAAPPPAPPVNTPTSAAEVAAPLAGGDWDFEADYVGWGNPYGEPCPGAAVAGGWTAFVEDGPYGSSCFNENLYRPNVFSGLKSQEITFDFIAANSGVLRSVPTTAGHRYSIAAYAKHDHSTAPVEMYLGIDLTGGTDWQAETVQWFPWDDSAEDTWTTTEETVTASGTSLTIFIRGFHPQADQGGKTVIDNVSVTDLGL